MSKRLPQACAVLSLSLTNTANNLFEHIYNISRQLHFKRSKKTQGIYVRVDNDSPLKQLLVCTIYIFGYSLNYYLHQARLNRLWQHLRQVVNINETTFELVNLSSHDKDEEAFLAALLKKAVSNVGGAEMGCIMKVNTRKK